MEEAEAGVVVEAVEAVVAVEAAEVEAVVAEAGADHRRSPLPQPREPPQPRFRRP